MPDPEDRQVAPESPVREIAPEGAEGPPTPGIALCLSGGGYRAMIFHVGVLWRLNEAGYLPRLARISSVSGGSITAGVLGLQLVAAGVRRRPTWRMASGAEVVDPLRDLAGRTIDAGAIVGGVVLPGVSVGERVEAAYRKHLFGDATLQDLPDQPRFVINATNVQSGALWRFSKPYMADYRVGRVTQADAAAGPRGRRVVGVSSRALAGGARAARAGLVRRRRRRAWISTTSPSPPRWC